MQPRLSAIKAALAECTGVELFALKDATYEAPQVAPRTLAWIEAACLWEWDRRTVREYELQPPEAAIPPEEDDISIKAVVALRAAFAHDSPALRALFAELQNLLTGKGRKH
jgi:hypothetical protein